MSNNEILLEGSYDYFQDNVSYSQENFKFIHNQDQQIYFVTSEILSRIETGEFLKILVRFEMNQHFIPCFVRIEKSMGNRYAQEEFYLDQQTHELKYIFKNSHGSQEFHRQLSAKHYLSSPAFSTAGIFTLSKKMDATGRTSIVLYGSSNEWDYQGPPDEKIIFADYQSREMTDFKLNNTSLPASHLCLFENDSSSTIGEAPVQLFLSKHFAIPYQLTHEKLKIVVKTLKKHN